MRRTTSTSYTTPFAYIDTVHERQELAHDTLEGMFVRELLAYDPVCGTYYLDYYRAMWLNRIAGIENL